MVDGELNKSRDRANIDKMEGFEANSGRKHDGRTDLPIRAQSLKIKIMRCLLEYTELNTLTISKRLNVHQSSISHEIRKMIEEKFIAKTTRGYRLTNIGQIYILSLDNFNAMLGSFSQHKDFIINHDINCIPGNHQMMMGTLFRGNDSMEVNSLKPYHKFEYLKHHLSISRKIFAASSVLIPELAKSMLQAARNGAKVKVILNGEILQSMKTDFPSILEEASSLEDVELYRNNEVKLLLIITESNLFLGLHRPDGSFDRDNIIFGEDEGAKIWGNALFNHFLTGSGKANASAP